MFKKVLIGLVMVLGVSRMASAQAVIAPTTLSFLQTAQDITATVSVRLDFFQCASVSSGGACVGQAAAPFQTGVDIPSASITTLNPVDSFGNNRRISLTVAPANGLLQATPAGVPFVGTLIATADSTQGALNSPRSAASNPFFGSGRVLAIPGNLRAQ